MPSPLFIDARQRLVTRGGPLPHDVIYSIDLVGDLWQDHLFFLQDAVEAEAAGDLRRRSRSVRASVIALLGHHEAVVTCVYKSLVEGEPAFQTHQVKNKKRLPWNEVSASLHAFYSDLPPLEEEGLKALRDVVAHPLAEKAIVAADGTPVTVAAATAYIIPLAVIQEGSCRIGAWLDRLCSLRPDVEREVDTAGIARKLLKELGEDQQLREI